MFGDESKYTLKWPERHDWDDPVSRKALSELIDDIEGDIVGTVERNGSTEGIIVETVEGP